MGPLQPIRLARAFDSLRMRRPRRRRWPQVQKLAAPGSWDGLGRKRRVAGLAGLVAQVASDPCLARRLPARDGSPADLGARRDFKRRSAFGRAEDDLPPPHGLERAVAIGGGGERTQAIRRQTLAPPWARESFRRCVSDGLDFCLSIMDKYQRRPNKARGWWGETWFRCRKSMGLESRTQASARSAPPASRLNPARPDATARANPHILLILREFTDSTPINSGAAAEGSSAAAPSRRRRRALRRSNRDRIPPRK